MQHQADTNNKTETKSILDDFFTCLGDLYGNERPLAAIWLTSPVQTTHCLKLRITEGDKVKIRNGELLDCENGDYTHIITACRGTLYSKFSITVMDKDTGELSIIKL